MTKPEEKIRDNYTGTTQTPDLYGKEYFEKYGTDCGPIPYRRDETRWLKFFGDVAEELNRSLKPCTVLDVGCAIGFLVEAFWRRGVRTYGIDISEYAISQVPQDLRLFCRALSATEPLPDDFLQTYDLITCIEVLEHLTEAEGRVAIENMASSTSCILFSSTPHDLTEPTHVNVRPIIYWLQLFAEVGFYPDLRFDASFVSPQAFLLRKSKPRLEEDALPFFSESIDKKFQINAQQEQIVGLTQSKQELQRQLEHEIGKRDKNQHELGETLRQERGVRQTFQGQVEALELEAEGLRSTAQQLAQEINQLQKGQLEPLELEAEGLRSTAQQLAQEIDQLQKGQLEPLEREAEGLRSTANQLKIALSVKSVEIAERDRKINSLQVFQSGLFWKLLVSYRRAKDCFLPLGSKRRALYDTLLAGVKAFKFIAQDRHPDLALASPAVATPIQDEGSNFTTRAGLNFIGAGISCADNSGSNRTDCNIPSATGDVTDVLGTTNEIEVTNSAGPQPAVEAKRETTLGVDQLVPVPIARSLQKFGLIISGCPGDAFRYRCEHQAEQLRFLGLTVDAAYFEQVDYRTALESYECYWLHRVPYTTVVEEFIHAAQGLGKPVIFDTDDLIFDEEKIPYVRALQWMPKDEVDLYYDGVRRYYRTLSLCRFATVTTEPLRETIRRLFPHIQCFINPNALSDAQLLQADEASKVDRTATDRDIVRIAYFSGTRTHNVDFQQCSGALVRVLKNYPNVKVMLVGHLDVREEFERFGDRIERYPLLPWQELPKLLRNVDINLAPLELDNPFTESKSALKYFEAAVMSVPTVASDVTAYQACIRHGENGFLCRTEKDWVDYLARLVEDNGLRREMGNRSKTEVLEQVTTRKQAARLKSIITEILQTRPQSLKSRLSVAFILRAPIAQVGGGYKNIFRLANYLADQGHEVNVYVEPIAHLEGKSDSEIVEFCHTYFGKSAAEIRVGHTAIKTCDIAIATNWPTAYVVASLTNTLCRAYLIQDFEPDFYEYDSPSYKEAKTTYDLPLRKITLGRYLANMFEREDHLPVAYIDFGIDHSIFNSKRRKVPGHEIRILFFARPALKRRGYEIGIEALKQVYKSCSQLEIYFYGTDEKEALQFPYTNLGILSPAELAQAMRNADIHLSFSLTNISFVPFEAMACGCAVVEAKIPSVDTMVEDGKHCLLAEPQPDAVVPALRRLIEGREFVDAGGIMSDAVVPALRRLIEDGDLRSRIAKTGMEFVRDKTWENSCKQFEDVVYDSLLMTRAATDEESNPNRQCLSPESAQQTGGRLRNVLSRDDYQTGIYYRRCNFCGGTAFRIFKRLDIPFPERIYGDQELTFPTIGKRLKLQYLECSRCGLVGINPLTRFADITRNSFDGERNIVAWADLDYQRYEDDKLNEIRLVYDQYEFENYRQANRILDVSCGPGVSLKWLRDDKGWEVFGVDPDRHSVRMAWDRYGVRIENGLIHDIGAPDEYFDIIILDNSLEHTFNPNSTLLKIFRLLRRGGGVFIFVPNSHGLSTKYVNANAHWGHWFLFDPKTLCLFLKRVGYNVSKLCAIQNPINPALIDKGVELSSYRAGLAVSLIGDAEIVNQIGKLQFYSDFFNLMAVKPNDANVSSDTEEELSIIAASSLDERQAVEIVDNPIAVEISSEHFISSISVRCNLCGSQEHEVLYQNLPQVFTDSAVVACKSCSLKRLEPRMASTQLLWSSTENYVFRDYIPLWSKLGSFSADGTFDASGNFRYWHNNVLERVQEFKQTNRLLDVGCAIGLLVEAAGRAGWVATGIDVSQPAIRFGMDAFGIDLRVGQIHEFSFPEDYFDVINFWDVIEHLTDPLGTLQAAWNILRPGGVLVIQTPNYTGPSRRLLGKQWDMFATEHFFYFEQPTLKRMFELVGFNKIKFETLGFDRSKVVSILGEDSVELQKLDEELKTGHVELDTLLTLAQKPIKPIVFKEQELAHKLLDNLKGLEIGAAAHNPFGLRTRNVCHPESYQAYAGEQQREMGVEPAPVDIWASAENIPVPDASEDFIISSHVVEHLPNLILTFIEWNRIVRDGGYVFIIVPQKGALPEDLNRELTTLTHFLDDYHREMTPETHSIDGVPVGHGGHYHTFTPDSVLELVTWMRTRGLCNWTLVAREDVDSKAGNGFTLVFQVGDEIVSTD